MTVLNCFPAGTLRIAALTLGMLSAPGLASAAQASLCGSEEEWCSLPASYDFYATSYGTEDRAFVVTTQNVAQIPCSNTGLGVPDYVSAKHCKYRELRPKPAESFVNCAAEGGVCNVEVPAGSYRVVRYGSPDGNRWLYNNVASKVACGIQGFGYNFDPVPNVNKICQVSTQAISPSPEWVWCAKEENQCAPKAGAGTYLIKYGVGDDWLYRTVVGTGTKCNPTTFGADPAYGQHKSCYYLPMPTVVPAVPTNPWNGSILPQGAQIRLRSTVQYVVQRDPISGGGYSEGRRDVPIQRLLDVEPNAVGALVLAPEGSLGSLFTVTTWSPADDPGQNTCQRMILQAPGGMFVTLPQTFGGRRYAASAAMSEARVFCLDRTQAPRAKLWDAGYEYSQRGRIEPSFARPNYLFQDGKYSAYVGNDVYEQPSFLGLAQGVPPSGTFEVFVP